MRKYIKAHDGMLLANHGALTVGADLFGAYYKMETVEHFAKISLVARLLGRENLIAREEVLRLQELRGSYGIQAPAPICADDTAAPERSGGLSGRAGARRWRIASGARRARACGTARSADGEARGEIRLTYRELSELIEDAIRNLRLRSQQWARRWG